MKKASSQDQPGSSSSSIPIRAPLTIDSDDSEYCLSSSNSSSTTSSVVDISSFNDEHDDDDIVLGQFKGEKCEISRPIVKYPDGNEVKSEVFRPSVECPDGKIVGDCSGFDKNDVFRPFVKYPNGKDSKDCGSFNDEHDDILAYPHNEIVLEQSRVEKCQIIRPFVKYPDGDYVKECGGLDKNEVFGPLAKYPIGNSLKDCGGFDKNDVFRTFVKYPDGNEVKDCGGFDKSEIFRAIVRCPDGKIVSDCSGSDKNDVFRPFVKYPDGNDAKDCSGFDKVGVCRPFVKYPNGNDSNDRGGFDKNEFSRPIVRCPDEDKSDNAKECDGFDKVGVFRPLVKYPYGDNVKDCGFDKGGVIRAFVKDRCEESSSSGGNLGVPVARLSGDCDSYSDSDVDSVDGVVESVVMAPKVRIFSADEGDDELQVEGGFSGDDSSCISELNKLSGDEKCRGECLYEGVKGSGSDEMSYDLGRVDAEITSCSGNETISGSEQEFVLDGCLSQSKKMDNEKEEEMVATKIEMAPKSRIFGYDEGDDISDFDGSMRGCISDESIGDEGCNVECLNLVHEPSDFGRIDAEIASCSGNETISGSEQEVVFDGCGNQSKKTVNKKEEELVATKIEMAPKFQIFGYDEGDAISDFYGSSTGCISDESIGDEGCKAECLNLVHDLSELNEMSKTVNESQSEVVDVYRTESKNRPSEVGEEMAVMKVVVATQAGIISGDEGEDISDFDGSRRGCISDESIVDEGCKVECLNLVDDLSELNEMSKAVNENGPEVVDVYRTESKNKPCQVEEETAVMKVVVATKAGAFSGDEGEDINDIEELKGLNGYDEGDAISDFDGSMTGCISDESVKVECLNLVHDLSELNEMSKTVNESEPEVVDVYRTESKNRLNEVEEEMAAMKVVVATKAGAFSGDEGDDINDIEELNGSGCSVSADTIDGKGYTVECLNEVVKISEPDEPSFDLERFSDSGNEIESASISGQEGLLVKTQPVKSKFLKLVRFLGLLNEFDSHLTILVIGKTGIGKSATINSIFSEDKASTNAFDPGTTIIQEIVGTIEGVELRVIDTPGLKCSPFERSYNLKILKSIKRLAKKHTPDIVLYVDRLDTHTRGDDDSHLLRLITSSLGSSVWRKCIIALTHAASSPTDESLRGFVFQRCHLIQEKIHNHGGTNEHMVNPVWLVENHVTYKHDKSRLLDFSSYLHHNIVLDDGLDGLVCSDQVNEDECGQIPPFEPFSKQMAVVNCRMERRKSYFEECSYRVKLLGTNHWYVACRLYL